VIGALAQQFQFMSKGGCTYNSYDCTRVCWRSESLDGPRSHGTCSELNFFVLVLCAKVRFASGFVR